MVPTPPGKFLNVLEINVGSGKFQKFEVMKSF